MHQSIRRLLHSQRLLAGAIIIAIFIYFLAGTAFGFQDQTLPIWATQP